MEHYDGVPCIKSMHMLAAPQGQVNDVICGVLKGRTFEKRGQERPECSNGIRKRREQIRLVNMRTLNETFRRTLELELVKLAVGSSIRLQKMSDRAL